jgi:hypothetical protein
MSKDITHVPHTDPNIAYHFEWEFRREALLWSGDSPVNVNFYPLATELRQWLLQQGQITVFAEEDKDTTSPFSNPYTYHASVIGAILSRSINASHNFVTDMEPMDEMDADIERIRLYNEQILYIARFCEASIKQLLYCTQIPKKYYKDAALGTLLSTDCRICKNSEKPRHKISLLGSLAHRYQLCLPFEQCLFEHIKIVNRRRNLEAAHSDSQLLRIRTDDASRAQLKEDALDAGNEFVHMLQHISDLETRMMYELQAYIAPHRPVEMSHTPQSI